MPSAKRPVSSGCWMRGSGVLFICGNLLSGLMHLLFTAWHTREKNPERADFWLNQAPYGLGGSLLLSTLALGAYFLAKRFFDPGPAVKILFLASCGFYTGLILRALIAAFRTLSGCLPRANALLALSGLRLHRTAKAA